jgi:acyl dehydratase
MTGQLLQSGFERFIPGEELGTSSWVTVTQGLVSDFGKSTLDADPMHIDPDWARKNTPFDGTIAFGFLTVSLLTHLLHDTLGTSPAREPADQGYFMNYGFDYLRLVAPVPVGADVRGSFRTIDKRNDEKGRNIVKIGCEIEVHGEQKPALVAEWLAIWIPPEAA